MESDLCFWDLNEFASDYLGTLIPCVFCTSEKKLKARVSEVLDGPWMGKDDLEGPSKSSSWRAETWQRRPLRCRELA